MNAERGAASVVVVAIGALVVSIAIAVAGLGLAYVGRARAINAADAAALAAAVSTYPPAARATPIAAARAIARMNGAELIDCRCPVDRSLAPRTVSVEVGVDVAVPLFGEMSLKASAVAEFHPGEWLAG